MIALSASEVAIYYESRVSDLRQRGKRWRGPCPIHRGKHDSFSVDPETGLWRCWSVCGRGGDIIALEIALTGAPWLDSVAKIEQIIGRALLDRPVIRAEQRASTDRRKREQEETRSAEFFRIAAASMAEQILDDLPEAVTARYVPTQLLIELRTAQGAALLVIYRDFYVREPRLTAALVYAGERCWRRWCTQLARFVAAGMEVPNVA
jgi:hypothetical protein